MGKYLFFFAFFGLSVFSNAQILQPGYFALQSSAQNNTESFLLGLPNNDVIMFWYDSLTLKVKSSRSTDNGLSWSAENTITTFINVPLYNVDINAIVLNSGRILLTYKNQDYKLHYSDDNGITWQQLTTFNIRPNPPLRARVYLSSFAKTSDGKVVFIYSDGANISNNYNARGIYYCKSLDGIYWEQYVLIDSIGRNGNWVSLGQNKDMIVFHDSTLEGEDIFYRITTDGGQTWSQREVLIGGEYSQKNARVIKDTTDKYWLFFEDEEATPFDSLTQFDINYVTSTDYAISWSSKQKFTSYKGIDKSFSLSLWNGKPVLSFASSRGLSSLSDKLQIYYGIGGETLDSNGPPYLFYHTVQPEFINASDPVTFRAWVLDDDAIDSVLVLLKEGGNDPVKYLMFDDGLHNDSLANDNIYGITLQNGFDNGTIVNYNFYSVDDLGNNSSFNFNPITIPTLNTQREYLLDVNKLKLPLNNKGILAAVNVNGQSSIRFEEHPVMFSGGFVISGENEDSIWASAAATMLSAYNYIAGPVGTNPNEQLNSIYSIKNTDPAFGTSWQQYRFAVQSGADFYDGNNDGIYNPLDLNGNGTWDANEDRPDIFGDETIWCVFNDSKINRTRYQGIEPQGIEIQQTVFASSKFELENIIFFRYRIINRGTVADVLDSVIVSLWNDADIGLDYSSDMVGCDTLLQSQFVYKANDDVVYGVNPPSFFTTLLQGPVVFSDASDTAYVNSGPQIGSEILLGMKNLKISSATSYISSDPLRGDPNDEVECRNYNLGLQKTGAILNPCSPDAWSHVTGGINCNEVNPLFWYSGDPVNQIGWLFNQGTDIRQMLNVGPFNLVKDEPVDILFAYVLGRGTDRLNSVTVARENVQRAIQEYQSNFSSLAYDPGEPNFVIDNYELFQNYPNPFNPTTTIRYDVLADGIVTLKVYDILGQEVRTLVNEFKPARRYEVNFSSKGLASGVYIYRLQVNGFDQSMKMIILK